MTCAQTHPVGQRSNLEAFLSSVETLCTPPVICSFFPEFPPCPIMTSMQAVDVGTRILPSIARGVKLAFICTRSQAKIVLSESPYFTMDPPPAETPQGIHPFFGFFQKNAVTTSRGAHMVTCQKKRPPLTTVNFLLPVTGGHSGPNGKRACFFPVIFQSFESLSVVTDGRIKWVPTLPLLQGGEDKKKRYDRTPGNCMFPATSASSSEPLALAVGGGGRPVWGERVKIPSF